MLFITVPIKRAWGLTVISVTRLVTCETWVPRCRIILLVACRRFRLTAARICTLFPIMVLPLKCLPSLSIAVLAMQGVTSWWKDPTLLTSSGVLCVVVLLLVAT